MQTSRNIVGFGWKRNLLHQRRGGGNGGGNSSFVSSLGHNYFRQSSGGGGNGSTNDAASNSLGGNNRFVVKKRIKDISSSLFPAATTRMVLFSTNRSLSSSSSSPSPFDNNSNIIAGKKKKKPRKIFIPPKAAVELTAPARNFLKALLENPPRNEIIGIMLNYTQSSTGEPRMVFSFDFVTNEQLDDQDESVSIEVLEDGVTPKAPKDAHEDGLPKLYINSHSLIKVMGCKVDIDIEKMTPILYDREGNQLDPDYV